MKVTVMFRRRFKSFGVYAIVILIAQQNYHIFNHTVVLLRDKCISESDMHQCLRVWLLLCRK